MLTMYQFFQHIRYCTLLAPCVILSTILSCSSSNNHAPTQEEKAAYLVGSVVEVLDSLPLLTETDNTFLENYRIPRKLQSRFLTVYSNVVSEINQLPAHYRHLKSVRFFLINRYLLHPEDSLIMQNIKTAEASPENPVFMAFSLYVEGLPDIDNIGSPTYIKTLARSFGTTATCITEGVRTLLSSPPSQLLETVAGMINDNLDKPEAQQPDFFFNNIIVPYLTYISKEYPLHPPIEKRVLSEYAAVFNGQDTTNDLRAFSEAFKAYLAGKSLHVKYINNLNTTLGKHNLRLFVKHKTCIGYHILKTRIPIRYQGIGEVILLKKANMALSASFLGLSTIKEADVILTVNDISDFADDIAYALDHQTALVSIKELNGGASIDSITDWCAKLLRKEFAGLPRKEVTGRLIRQIAVHEVKHKWDEVTGADSNWYTVDCEVSAHLAECIFGGIPFYSLMSFHNRLYKFYVNIDNGSVRSLLRRHIGTCRDYIRLAAIDSLNSGDLKLKLKQFYREYKTITNEALPPIDGFYEDVVRPDLETFPEIEL